MLNRFIVHVKKLFSAVSLEHILCRLLAAWCSFAAFTLLQGGHFSELAFAQNLSWGYIILTILGVFLLYSFIHHFLHAEQSDSWLLLSSATICVIHWLITYNGHWNRFLFLLGVLAVYALFVAYFIQKNPILLNKWAPSGKTVRILSIGCGVFCGFVIAAITGYRYLTFSSPNFDFGLFVHMFHNMKETGIPLCTSERDVPLSHFVVHLSPIYYFLLPVYAVFPSPLTLQIGQAFVLASGVLPLTRLCTHLRLSGKCTLLAVLIYCFHPVLTTGCFYDIHENCFLAPLLLWLFDFFERKKYGYGYLFAFLTLLVKEDAAIYVGIFALYVLLGKKEPLHGCLLLLGALAYFGLALSILETSSAYYAEIYANASPNPPINGPMVDRFGNLIFDAAAGLVGALKTAVVNPGYLLTQLFTADGNGWEKFIYVCQLFLPVGFIPFLTSKPSRWLLLLPTLLNLLTNYPYQYDIGFQYHFGILPFLLYATVINLSDLRGVFRRISISLATVACCCLYVFYVFPVGNQYYTDWQRNKDTYRQMEDILDTIPPDASVCCSTFLVAHIADRKEVYELDYHEAVGDVDYVLFDARYAIDDEQINAFLHQGYQITQERAGLIIVLTKAPAPLSQHTSG